MLLATLEKLRAVNSKCPLSLTYLPINCKKGTLKTMNNYLNLSISNNQESKIENILQKIPEAEYISEKKILFNLKLNQHSFKRPSNNCKNLSFQEFINRNKQIFIQKIYDQVPEWWIKTLYRNLAKLTNVKT